MADYRCYFLGPRTTSPMGVPSLIEAAENFRAETDAEARSRAEAAYGRRRNHGHGFELWQGTRLVHRQPPSAPASRAPSGQITAHWPIDRSGLAALIDAGLSNGEIGAYFSVSADDVHVLRERYGLSGEGNERRR